MVNVERRLKWPGPLVVAGSAILALVIDLVILGADGNLSRGLYDSAMELRGRLHAGQKADPFLVVIELEEDSVGAGSGSSQIADSLKALSAAGVKDIFLPTILHDSTDELRTVSDILSRFDFAGMGGVCMPIDASPGIGVPRLSIPGTPPPRIPRSNGFYEPASTFDRFVKGHLNLVPDADGFVRRLPLFFRDGDAYIPAAPLVFAMQVLGIDAKDLRWEEGRFLRVGKTIRIPVDSRGMALLDFPIKWDKTFWTFDARQISRAPFFPSEQTALRQELRGSSAFVVDRGPGVELLHVPGQGLIPSSLVAPIFANELSNRIIPEEIPQNLGAFLVAAEGMALGLLMGLVAKRTTYIWAAPIASALISLGLSYAVFASFALWIDPVPFALLCLIAALFGGAWQAIAVRREREALLLKNARDARFAEFGRHSAGAVHGIKGQIAMIRNLSGMLVGKSPSPREREILDVIGGALEELSGEIADVMSYVTTDGARSIDAVAILRNFHVVQSRGRPDLIATIHLPDYTVPIAARKDEFLMAVEVFFTNAIESYVGTESRDGRVVSIGLERKEDRAIVTVGDRGQGISACSGCHPPNCINCDVIINLGSDKTGGSGYGLPWAREIIVRNKAGLKIKTEEGKGTLVEIDWPLAQGGE